MLSTTEDWNSMERLKKAMAIYRSASTRSLAEILIKTAHEMAFALHAETMKLAPPIDKLRGLPAALNWRIKRRSGSVKDEISRRIDRRFYHAAGWKPALKGFIDKQTVTTIRKSYGEIDALVEIGTGICHIILVNRIGVIAKLNSEHQILDKAVSAVILNFSGYRKLNEDQKAALLNI